MFLAFGFKNWVKGIQQFLAFIEVLSLNAG